MKDRETPIFENYKCHVCGIITSKWATKLQCGCHKKHNFVVNLGGVLHLADEKVEIMEPTTFTTKELVAQIDEQEGARAAKLLVIYFSKDAHIVKKMTRDIRDSVTYYQLSTTRWTERVSDTLRDAIEDADGVTLYADSDLPMTYFIKGTTYGLKTPCAMVPLKSKGVKL